MLHSKDYSPLLRRMVCPREETIVPPDEIIRGYEIGPDKYIVITDEELESVTPERSRTIEIVEFIDMRTWIRSIMITRIISFLRKGVKKLTGCWPK